jgi:hypothetical protein
MKHESSIAFCARSVVVMVVVDEVLVAGQAMWR